MDRKGGDGKGSEDNRERFKSLIAGRGRVLARQDDSNQQLGPALSQPGPSVGGANTRQQVQNLMRGVGGARSRRNEAELTQGLQTLALSRSEGLFAEPQSRQGGDRSTDNSTTSATRSTMQRQPCMTKGGAARPQDLNQDLLRRARRTNLEEYPTAPDNYREDVWTCASHIPDLVELGNLPTFDKEMLRWVKDGNDLIADMEGLGLWDAKVLGLDFEFSAGQTYEGFICLASVASPEWTLLIDCLNDTRKEPSVQTVLSGLGNSEIIKVVCGGANDLTRMKKDWGCYPVNIVDIQELYVKWVKQDPSKCFKKSLSALREQAAKNPNRDATDAGLRRFMEYDLKMPGLGYLMRVFEIKDVKESTLTMSDWTRRPIAPNMRMYAAKDSYYALQIFYELLNKVGMQAVREVARSTANKAIGKAPKYKVPANVGLDRIGKGILEWREYLAKTLDCKPDQILDGAKIASLSKWVSSHTFDPKNYEALLEQLTKLNFNARYAPSVKLLAAHLNPDDEELQSMKLTICHNCNSQGHVAFFCPTDPSSTAKKEFMKRPENLPKQVARNEKKLVKMAAKVGKTVDEIRPQMLEKWKQQQNRP